MFDHLCHGLRNRGVSDMADLAMILVVGAAVPVGDRVRRERGQRQHDRESQQAIGDSFRHARVNGQVEAILPPNHRGEQSIGSPGSFSVMQHGRPRLPVDIQYVKVLNCGPSLVGLRAARFS